MLRATAEGFAKGHMQLQGTDRHEGSSLRIDFQNENLVAIMGEQVLASVPDLICCLDADSMPCSMLVLNHMRNAQVPHISHMSYGLQA